MTLDPESVVAFRNRAYGRLVTHYSIIVPSPTTVTVHLSDSTTVYGIGGLHKIVQFVKMYRRVALIIKSGKCNLITTQDMYFLGFLGLYFARKYRLGLEIQVLGIEKLTPFRKLLAKYVLRNSSVVRALSERIQGRLLNEFGVDARKVNVVPIYVDVNKLGLNLRMQNETAVLESERIANAFKEQYGSFFNFLTVSRLVPIKQISMQLRALKRIVLTEPAVRLHIVGDGPDEQKLKTEVKNLGLADYVIFHGRQTGLTLGMFYRECDCFVLTSDYEGWGMVIVEAATAGLPVIMTDVGCAGEFIINGESGIVIPVGDEDALVDAMLKVQADTHMREELSLGTKKAINSLQSFDAILAQYKENWDIAFSHPL